MDSSDTPHTSTGWQFEQLRSRPEVVEMSDYNAEEDRTQSTGSFNDLIVENANFAYENFKSDRPQIQTSDKRQWGQNVTSGAQIIRNDLPSHHIDGGGGGTSDDEDVVVRRRYNPSSDNKRSRITTLQMRKAVMSQARDNIDQTEVIDALVQDPELSGSSPESEQLRIDAIRDLHYSLPVKRSIKRQMSLVAVCDKPTDRPVFGGHLRFTFKKGFRSFKTKCAECLRNIDFWRAHIHKVEGRFGSSTAYYFRFLQQLFALNLLIFIISCSFILVPYILDYTEKGEEANPRNESGDSHSELLTEAILMDQARFAPWLRKQTESGEDPECTWSDILTGSGCIAHTALYYGAYRNETIDIIDAVTYNLPLAYLLATVCHLLLCLFLLASWVAGAYKKYLSANSSYGVHTFCNLVFCSWDFTIVSQEACDLKRMGILHDLQEKVDKYMCKTPVTGCAATYGKYCKRLINHAISLVALVMCGYLVWYLLEQNTLQTDLPVLTEMTLPLVVTGIFIILPVVFSTIVMWEGYEARSTEVYATLVRMMLLLMTILGVLCYFWFGTNYEYIIEGHELCWETSLGEEVYRLLLVDFLVSTLVYFLVSYLQKSLPFPKLLGNSEFNLAWNTWNLIYTQMLCWLGSLYSPMISGIVLMKLILTFYLKQLHVRLNCTPPAKPWGASQAKTVFLLTAFLGLIATLIPVGYSIIAMAPSTTCGPFRGKETAYDVVFDLLKYFHIERELFGLIMYFLTRPGCVAAIIVVLCAIAFQAKANAETNKSMVKRIQEQLILEGTDKNFLLQMVDKATQMQAIGDGPKLSSATQLPSNRRSIRQPVPPIPMPSSAAENGLISPRSNIKGQSGINALRLNMGHRDSITPRRPSTVPEARSSNPSRFQTVRPHR